MKCDVHGNIFATGPGGVCVMAPLHLALGLAGFALDNLLCGAAVGLESFVLGRFVEKSLGSIGGQKHLVFSDSNQSSVM